jgi:hypothetical protein
MQGSFSEDSLKIFHNLASQSQGLNYSESGTDSYDFTRCVRPDGTSFGTSGKCTPPNRQAAPSILEAEANREEEEARQLMSGGRRNSRAMQRRAKELIASAQRKRSGKPTA